MLNTLPPMIARNIIARRIAGTQLMTSMTRMIRKSAFLLMAQTDAIMALMMSETSVAPAPMPTEMRLPCSTRANRSRPRLSVPNQCAALGGDRRAEES